MKISLLQGKAIFRQSFNHLHPRYKALIFISAGVFSIASYLLVINLFKQQTLIIAAGKNTGESYKISKAIQKVAAQHNLKIKICTTDGTEQNLALLEQGKVDFAAAQFDYASEEVGKEKSIGASSIEESENCNNLLKILPHELSQRFKPQVKPKSVAVLYHDYFQVFVKDKKINSFQDFQSKNFIVDVPEFGGQKWSFLRVAEHYGLKESDFSFNDCSLKKGQDYITCQQAANIIFRVRAINNQDIANLLKKSDGKLLPIEQVEAMRFKYPAFKLGIIPKGIYNATQPNQDLITVMIPRILLAGEKVENNKVEKITRILFSNHQEISNALDELNYQSVKPLIASISNPTASENQDSTKLSIPTHQGALAFYNEDNNVWKKLNDNGNALNFLLAFLLASVTLVPIVRGIVSFLVFSEQRRLADELFAQQRELADDYINKVIALMSSDTDTIESRQHQLDEEFKKAAQALSENRITQESFRTFNEAYKTAREAIERERLIQQQKEEQIQKNEVDKYISQAIKLMSQSEGDIKSRQEKLNDRINEVSQALIAEKITQESFRTFNEAYKNTREAIEREKEGIEQQIEHQQREKSAVYIKAVVELLQDSNNTKEELQRKLDGILKQVARDLVKENISQESFRTFVEAYKTTRDAIERIN